MPDKANPGLGITRIVADLRDLCERDATGIYFIVTDDRHQARIALVSGDIVFVAVGDGADLGNRAFHVSAGAQVGTEIVESLVEVGAGKAAVERVEDVEDLSNV